MTAQIRDLCLTFGGNRPTMLLQGHRPKQGPLWQHRPGPLGPTVGYSHELFPHYPCISSSTSLHCPHVLPLPFLSHPFTTYSLILASSRASGFLGSPQECYAPSLLCATKQGIILNVVCPPESAWYQGGSQLRLPLPAGDSRC